MWTVLSLVSCPQLCVGASFPFGVRRRSPDFAGLKLPGVPGRFGEAWFASHCVDTEESPASEDSASERDAKSGAVSTMMVGKVVCDGIPLRLRSLA
ncbi:hypothetical protein B0H19DRAFT_1121767 [Mycena capillaripes]|nr:hypothetical protein B0H19DRAFT_1121767 [Mycena capillaripes]